ncbi:MAG: Cof-type HAD-IIB family hydrolase [Proteobacteria bacterium]|nr:Cof-type HAD-IIB family hydrolase [Pseudomonadota bacterium]
MRLVGIDVDGTLVGTGGIIHPRVWEAATRARERGIHLALCSGRPAFGVALEYARRLEANGWHIFQNGASILSLATGQSRSVPIPAQWVKTLIYQARTHGEVLELYSDREYAVESTTAWAKEHADLLGVPFEPRPLDSLTEPIVRAQWLLSVARAAEYRTVSHPGLEIAQSSSPLMTETQFVGLTHEGVTKGRAMSSIAESYGVPLQNVMYIGDSGNDLPALGVAGYPIAMGNAEPAVKAAARHTVDHVDRGGVAQALEMAIAS